MTTPPDDRTSMTCQCHTPGAGTQLPGGRALVRDLDEQRERPGALDLFLLIESDQPRAAGAVSSDEEAAAALDHALEDVAHRHQGTAYRVSAATYAVLLDAPEAAPYIAVGVAFEAAVAETAPWLASRIVHERAVILGCGGEGEALAYTAMESLGRRLAREPRSPGRQARDVLLRMLSERRDDSRAPRRPAVASLAVTVGRALGLSSGELDDMVRAAELQDIGLAVLPDAVRMHGRALSDREWALVRRHPVVGERIVGAAPALVPVARLVRSVYERVDGTGYPDGLLGEEIPVGARIIAACVAFDAMITDRPHRPARSPQAALTELEDRAGTQFDPAVVRVLCAIARSSE